MSDQSAKSEKKLKPLTGAAVHLSHLKIRLKNLENKRDNVIPKLSDEMQSQALILTEQRIADTKKQIAKLSK